MNIPVIPWQVFIDALLEQQPDTRENWLRRWLFTNEGVIMADERITTNNSSPVVWSNAKVESFNGDAKRLSSAHRSN